MVAAVRSADRARDVLGKAGEQAGFTHYLACKRTVAMHVACGLITWQRMQAGIEQVQ